MVWQLVGCRPTVRAGWDALATFERFATAWRGTEAGVEDCDALVYELIDRWFDAQGAPALSEHP